MVQGQRMTGHVGELLMCGSVPSESPLCMVDDRFGRYLRTGMGRSTCGLHTDQPATRVSRDHHESVVMAIPDLYTAP